MVAKLNPTLVARYEIERSKTLILENQIRRENIRCEMIELRQTLETRRKVRR